MRFKAMRWVICFALLAACASSGEKKKDEPREPREDSHVIVQNDYMADMEVFILTGSIKNRIGVVSTGGKRQFLIPERFMVRPELLFYVVQASASTTTTGYTFSPVIMTPGSTVELKIARVLTMSGQQVLGR